MDDGTAKQESCYLFDWVSFTLKTLDVDVITSLLGLSNVEWIEAAGHKGYKRRLYYESISIHYDGQENMGIWCEMSGQGCRAYETYGAGDYHALFNFLLSASGCNITRIDIAFDDHDGLLDIKQLLKDAQKGNYVSWWNKLIYTGGTEGVNIQHGKKISETYLRIYDKAAEKGYTDGRHWVRTELILKNDRARAFVERYIEDPRAISYTFMGVLANYIRYVVPNKTDENKRRWKTAKYWEKFINGAEKVTLFRKPGTEYNLAALEMHVEKQMGAISAYIDILGVDSFFFRMDERIKYGRNPKYDELVHRIRGSNKKL